MRRIPKQVFSFLHLALILAFTPSGLTANEGKRGGRSLTGDGKGGSYPIELGLSRGEDKFTSIGTIRGEYRRGLKSSTLPSVDVGEKIHDLRGDKEVQVASKELDSHELKIKSAIVEESFKDDSFLELKNIEAVADGPEATQPPYHTYAQAPSLLFAFPPYAVRAHGPWSSKLAQSPFSNKVSPPSSEPVEIVTPVGSYE